MRKIKKYLRGLLNHFQLYGFNGIVVFFKITLNLSEKIHLPNYEFPLLIRKNTSDKFVFRQIFIDKDYDIDFRIKPQIIIDAGANTGLSAIFFTNKFPKAKVFSIEPENSNFKCLLENTKYYKNILCLQNALSNIPNQKIETISLGLGKWGFTTRVINDIENSKNENIINSITIDEIVSEYNIKHIDILKIDIEGGEKELFESNYSKWIPITKYIIIEFHDRMKDRCKDTFFNAINKYNFSYFIKGENYIFVNNDLIL